MQNRSQFFGIAARIMRQILVDHARSHQARKRGGDLRRVSVTDCVDSAENYSSDLISLNDGLEELAGFDPRKAKAVDLRYFGGLTIEETADALGVSRPTVERDLRAAQAWLSRYMKGQRLDS